MLYILFVFALGKRKSGKGKGKGKSVGAGSGGFGGNSYGSYGAQEGYGADSNIFTF